MLHTLLITPCSNECFRSQKFRSQKLVYGVYAETSKRVRFMARFKSSCVKGVPCTAGTALDPVEWPKSILFVMGSEVSLSPAVSCLEISIAMLQLALSKY